MKAFIVLACLAVASAEPTYDFYGRSFYGIGSPLVGLRSSLYGLQAPIVGLTHVAVNKDQARLAQMKKQSDLMTIERDAKINGDLATAAAARFGQDATQYWEKPLLENQDVLSNLYKREAESYTPAQVAAMGLFTPRYITYGNQYPLTNFAVSPLVRSIYPGITYPQRYISSSPLQPYSAIVKREADAEPEPTFGVMRSSFYGVPSYLRSAAVRYPNVYNRVAYTSSVVPTVPAALNTIPAAIPAAIPTVRGINTPFVNPINTPFVNQLNYY